MFDAPGDCYLLEGTSSTPWNSTGFEDDLLLEFSTGADGLNAALLPPVVGWASGVTARLIIQRCVERVVSSLSEVPDLGGPEHPFPK